MNIGSSMKHKLLWHPQGWEDYLYWIDHDKKIIQKINALLKNMDTSPYEGIGKPEKLLYGLQGYWSRRITQEHRLVNQVTPESLIIISSRFYYQ